MSALQQYKMNIEIKTVTYSFEYYVQLYVYYTETIKNATLFLQ